MTIARFIITAAVVDAFVFTGGSGGQRQDLQQVQHNVLCGRQQLCGAPSVRLHVDSSVSIPLRWGSTGTYRASDATYVSATHISGGWGAASTGSTECLSSFSPLGQADRQAERSARLQQAAIGEGAFHDHGWCPVLVQDYSTTTREPLQLFNVSKTRRGVLGATSCVRGHGSNEKGGRTASGECSYSASPGHAVIKPGKKARVVFDLARNFNDFLVDESFHMSSIQDAVELAMEAGPQAWFVKLDISA